MFLTALQPQSEPTAKPGSIEWCESSQHRPGILLSRFTSNRVFRDSSALNRVSEQNSHRYCPAASRIDKKLRRFASSGVALTHSFEPTDCLQRKSSVCGLNGQRVYFLIALSLVTYGNAI